jgi:hypothetical protein
MSNEIIGNVLVIKLSSGEEILGKVVDVKENTAIALQNTLAIGYERDNKGQIGYGFIPWGPLVSDVKFINMNHIIYASEPKDSLAQAYNQATGAIVTPSKQIITE